MPLSVRLSVVAALFSSCICAHTCSAAVRLSSGDGDYVIRLGPDATKTDRLAAQELRHHLARAVGATLPIVTDGDGPKAFEIGTARARRILGARYEAFRDEESGYAVRGETVAVAGKGAAGNAYGVYLLLERELGCRWLTLAGDDCVPEGQTLRLADGTFRSERPRLAYRDVLEVGSPWKADSSDWLFLFRNRINQVRGNFENPVRGDLDGALVPRLRELTPACHSLFFYVPPKDHFAAHPEYYSLETNGTRCARQLCFSNPGLRAELRRSFLRHAESVGGKGFLDLSAQDSGSDFCFCDGCRALKAKYGSVGGPLFDFLLELAPEAKARFPELVIHFLVYRKDQTQRPPVGTEPWPDNLAAVFAPIDDDFSKDWLHPANRGTFEDLLAWKRLVRVWLWYYPVTYCTVAPFGGLERCATDTRLAVENGLDGAYYEHDVGLRQGIGFADLQLWMMLRQFRDPSLDWRALRDEFCAAYYGPAAPEMIAWDEDLERIRRGTKATVFWHQPVAESLTPENLVRWNGLFSRMERRLAGDPARLQRVREARVGLDVETLRAYRRIPDAEATLGTPEAIDRRARETVRRALERRYDVPETCAGFRKQYAQLTDMWLDAGLALATADPKPLPEPFAALPPEDVLTLYPERMAGPMEKVADAEAALGFAARERNVPEADQLVPHPCGVRDWVHGTDAVRRCLGKDEIVPDRFRFYRLGTMRLRSSDCRLWIGKSWNLTFSCSRLYRPGCETDEWEAWVSLKFTGPAFGGSGAKSEVLFDRALFVRRH